MKVYQKLASPVGALKRCQERNNEEWVDRHQDTIDELMQGAPSGSGVDSGTELLIPQCGDERIVLSCDYHHMDDNGMYSGWTHHQISVTPSFVGGFTLKISGPNRNQIKDYLGDLFHQWLDQDLSKVFADRRVCAL